MASCPNFVHYDGHRSRRGFTLVELLVVIGIIALLISILLPALSRARKEARTLKCAANLRSIGQAYFMYAEQNNGFWPPARMGLAPSVTYSIGVELFNPAAATNTTDPHHITVGDDPHWYDFIERYLTGGQLGVAASIDAHKSPVWGCTEWTGFNTAYVESDPGYGVNYYPTFTASYPTANNPSVGNNGTKYTTAPAAHESSWISEWSGGPHGGLQSGEIQGSFLHAKDYTHPAERALAMDSRYWIVYSEDAPKGTPLSEAIVFTNAGPTIGLNKGQTYADFYRHGDAPKLIKSGGGRGTTASVGYAPGGRIAYNILYCDGHVATSHSKEDAFKSIRMRYPDPN